MMISAARCGIATASSRQMPIAATPRAATVSTDGPGFGAGAMGWTQHYPAQYNKALAGDDQETHDAAGTRIVS
jgi:hypothetical protein